MAEPFMAIPLTHPKSLYKAPHLPIIQLQEAAVQYTTKALPTVPFH